MSLFRNKIYLSVTLGHFILDVFANAGPVLVTFLSIPMGLSTAQIGLTIGIYQFVGALSQPFFGWLADKIGARWLGPISVTWLVGFMDSSVLAAQVTGSFALFTILFVLGSFGSGAFHPLGTKHAADESGPRAATGTAVFFGFGQTGLALGPVLAGIILEMIGVEGFYGLALLALPLLIFMFYGMRHAQIEAHVLSPQLPRPALTASPEAVRWGAIGVLALLIGLRSWAFLGTVAFLPKIFQDMNWSATAYGLITGTFWFASALTGAVAGNLADRWGRRPVVFATMLLGSIPLYFLPLNSGWQAFPLAVVAGGLLGASHSILVVIAQDVLPLRKAFSSGITLGFLFGVGAIATWGIGALADAWGLILLIQIGAGIGVLAAILALFLPKTRNVVAIQPVESAAA